MQLVLWVNRCNYEGVWVYVWLFTFIAVRWWRHQDSIWKWEGGGYNCDRFENLGGVQLIGLNISKLDRMGRILKAKQNGKKSLLKLLYDNCWFELQQYLCCNQRDCKRDLKWPLMHEKMAILHSQRYPWNLYLINIVDAIVVCKVWKFV